MKVWTLMPGNPFRLAGSSKWRPTGFEATRYAGPYELGHGYRGFVLTAPNGTTFVAEATSGAFVGPTVEAVRRDVSLWGKEFMDDQVAKAVEQAKELYQVTEEEFWKRLGCNAAAPTKEKSHV